MVIEKAVIKKALDKHNLVAKEACPYCNGTGYSKRIDTICFCVMKKQPDYAMTTVLPSRKNVQQIMEELRAHYRNQKRC